MAADRSQAAMDDSLELIAQLELELLSPAARASRRRLDELIADDFVEVGASGLMFGKDVVLAHLPEEEGKTFEASQLRCRMLSPTVCLVTYRCVRRQGDAQLHSRRSSIWTRTGGSWQMIYNQGTRCEPPDAG